MFLAEFVRKAGLLPPRVPHVTPPNPQSEPTLLTTLSDQSVATAANVRVSINAYITNTSDSTRLPQTFTRLPKQSLSTFIGIHSNGKVFMIPLMQQLMLIQALLGYRSSHTCTCKYGGMLLMSLQGSNLLMTIMPTLLNCSRLDMVNPISLLILTCRHY